MVRFWILIGSSPLLGPNINKDDPLTILYDVLIQNPYGPASILSNVTVDKCKFYRFGTPVSATGKQEVVKMAFDTRDDWLPIDEMYTVERIADEKYLTFKYVCLVIEPPQAKKERALNKLRTKEHRTLFESLQIVLRSVQAWSRDDVEHNLRGGSFWAHGQQRTQSIFIELEAALAAKRTYVVSWPPEENQDAVHDFEVARRYSAKLGRYFQSTNTRQYVVNNTREFIAFFAVLRCHLEDSRRVSNEDSSHFKANHLSSYFFVPPFFSSQLENSKTKFQTELSWKFPIFVATQAESSNWCTFTPVSDFGVISTGFLCPFMLCEVISIKTEVDRWRLLVEAIAAARVGFYLKNSEDTQFSKSNPFFVVAVYLQANLIAERYVVMQTAPSGKVSIAQVNYDLLQSDQALDFLREMYNFQEKMTIFAEELNAAKKGALQDVKRLAGDLPSLTEQRKVAKRTGTLRSIQEDSSEHAVGAKRTPFIDDPEIIERLDAMHYRVDMVLFGFEHVAMISCKSNEFDRGFLKLTKREREVEVLQYLEKINSPDNHTIPGVQIWTRSSGGFVIYTSSGGAHLTDLRRPDEHLWSAARQLVEGVAFMHKHGVAHRDIKPANVLIPPDGGHLSIIDYSIAIFADGCGNKSCGMVGTEGYMAPEVTAGDDYDAMRADLWSSGKTLEVLCSLCGPSMQSAFIVNISRELMATDPLERPTMLDVLTRMAVFESSPSERPQIRFTSPLVVAEARS